MLQDSDLDSFLKNEEDAPVAPKAATQGFTAPTINEGSITPEIARAFRIAAREYDVDENVLIGIAAKESAFDPDVITGKRKSKAGAIGLMQFMPDTAKRFGIDPTDPIEAIVGAAAYLRSNLNKFGGDYRKAIAGYNWGENRKEYDAPDWEDRLPAETKDYLGYVSQYLGQEAERNPKQELPAGVKPSEAGAGRGFVNPPMADEADLSKPFIGFQGPTGGKRGATPVKKSGSVMDGVQIPETAFDPQEAERLSNRAYAEGTPIPGNLNDPRLKAPSMRESRVVQDPNAVWGESFQNSSLPVRAAMKAASGAAEGVGGVARAVGEIAGIDTLAKAGRATAEGAGRFQEGMGKNGPIAGFGPNSPLPYLADMGEGAAASMAQSLVSGLGLGRAAVIPALSIITAGQEYNKAREAGLDPAMALAGAIPKGAFEAIGEKFSGLDKAIGAIGVLVNRGASDAAKRTAADVLVRSGIREVPGEIITYLGQTATDLLPGIGLNQNLTMGQFLDGLRDVVVQSAMMGGAMGGAGIIKGGGLRRPTPAPSADQMARDAGFLVAEPTTKTSAEKIADISKAETIDEVAAKALEVVNTPVASAASVTTAPDLAPTVDAITALENTNVSPSGDSGVVAAGAPASQADQSGPGVGAAGLAVPDSGGSGSVDTATADSSVPASGAVPQPGGESSPAVEPSKVWYGRRGDGYLTPEDAQRGLGERQRLQGQFDWRIEPTPDGKYRLAGYAPSAATGTVQASAPAYQAVNQSPITFRQGKGGSWFVGGDPATIRDLLRANGITNFLPTKDGAQLPANTDPEVIGAIRMMAEDFKNLSIQELKNEIRQRMGMTQPPKEPKQTRSFRDFLRSVGIRSDIAGDVVGESNRMRANQILPMTFRRNGLNLDALAERALEMGFLTQQDIDNPNDNGGVNRLVEMIKAESRGVRQAPIDEQTSVDAEQAQAEKELTASLDKLGVPASSYADLSVPQMNSMLNRIERRLRDARLRKQQLDVAEESRLEREAIQMADQITLADVSALERRSEMREASLEQFMRALLFTEQEIQDELAKQANQAQSDQAPAGDAATGPQGSAEADAGNTDRASQAGPAGEVDLFGAAPNASQQEANRIRQEREDRERAQQQSAPSPDEFTLSGSDRAADVGAASGQGDLLAPTEKENATSLSMSDGRGKEAVESDQVAAPKADADLVKVMTVFGKNTYVRRADMDGDPNRLVRQFTKEGKNNGRIARGNLDPTGEQRKALATDDANNPLFNVITRKDGVAFATKESAQRELKARGLEETHEVVQASTLKDGADGFIVSKKQQAMAPSATKDAQQAEVPALAGIRGLDQQGAASERARKAREAGTSWAVGIPGKLPEYEAPTRASAEAFITPSMRKLGFVAYPMAQAAPSEPMQEGKAEPSPKAKIDDFGEKLTGARKDYAATLKDAEGVDVATEPLSKSWPEPDYDKLLAGGADPFVVAFVHAARDEIPTKPQKSWKLKGWVESVQALRDMATRLLDGSISRDKLEDRLSRPAFDVLRRNVGSRSELYQLIGHGKSLKGITFAKNHYSLYKGQENVTKWVVEQKAKATAFSNWPRELAVGDTKEEMLENFKAKFASMDTSPSAKGQAQFVIYRKRNEPGVAFVGKKIGREYIDLHKTESVSAARKYLRENTAELEKTLEAYKATPLERKPDNQPRVGDDHRNGAPVTPAIFAETFGFRGVQFGNYVEQGRRQSDLNEAYDGLMDMAAVLGIPPKALSLNGKLGLAFGARGKGGRGAPAAHYESGTIVINLTKGGGPGSLAHEWWHALDNYFGNESGSGGYGTGTVLGDKTRAEMRAAFEAVKTATQAKTLRRRAQELDKRKSKPYWDTPIELSARSFESYIIAKLEDQGAANDYLANVVDKAFWDAQEALRAGLLSEAKQPETFPYPIADEMPAVRAAFDDFFKTVQTREDDSGNVALYEPSPQPYTGSYETDLFGNPLPSQAPGRASGAKPRGAGLRGDVQPEPAVLGDAAQGIQGDYYVETIVSSPVSRELGASVIRTPADLAQATQYLYKSAVERFDAIVTDKDGKPLAVVGNFKGALSQTSVYPSTVVAEAFRVPGAAHIWFSHNHPSGLPTLSAADEQLGSTMARVFRGSSITPMGIMAVGKGRYSFQAELKPLGGDRSSGDIPKAQGRFNVPVYEREQQDERQAPIAINGPQAAQAIGKSFYDRSKGPGILLLDAQHGVNGWLPVNVLLSGPLRDTGGMDALYRAISRSNAGSAILVHGGELSVRVPNTSRPIDENIAGALLGIGVRVLDSIDVTTGGSVASSGLSVGREGVFFSRGSQPFYSSLRQSIEKINAKALPPGLWKDGIRGLLNKGAVKADEIEWSGLNEWLDLQSGKVTKDQVLAFLDANGVQVQEVVLGSKAGIVDSARASVVRSDDLGYDSTEQAMSALRRDFNRTADADEVLDAYDLEPEDRTNIKAWLEENDLAADKTKYSQYTLPGGTNYREVLLTLPVEKQTAWRDKQGRIWTNDEMADEATRRLALRRGAEQIELPITDRKEPIYRSSHWDQPNVLAHIRMNDRVDAGGAKTLLIEEIQSDFAQDYRKSKDAINKAVDDDFEGIIKRMKDAGVLEVNCD